MKKRKYAVMMLMCFTLAGCADMSNGIAPETAPTPTEPFVYGKTSPCLADNGRNAGSEDITSGIDGTERVV